MTRRAVTALLGVVVIACSAADSSPSTTSTLSVAPTDGTSAATTTEANESTTSESTAATPTTQGVGRRVLAPGWELLGEGDRLGALAFGTGNELIVWGGVAPNAEGPRLFNGVAWNHESRTSRQLPAPPIDGCPGFSAGTWTGTELVVWLRSTAASTCGEGGVAAYLPAADTWRLIDAPEFLLAGSRTVWTGYEILSWGTGLALNPESGEVRTFTPFEINEVSYSPIHSHWTGDSVLVTGASIVNRYSPEEDDWERLDSPPIGVIAQATAWTGDRLLAVNYEMEAAVYDPEQEAWNRIESMPMRFYEDIPYPFSSPALTMVQTAVSMAALDSDSWLTMPRPVIEWDGELPYGAPVIADGWIYQVGNFVLRRPVPIISSDGFQTEPVVPLQTLLFEIPDGWIAKLVPGGSSDHFAYTFDGDQNRSCRVDAHHGLEPPPDLPESAVVYSSWNGGAMTIGVDISQNASVVSDWERSSDWVGFSCNSPEAAQVLASYVLVRP